MSKPVKAYAGFDVSTKAIDLAVITAEGDQPEIIMFARCNLTQAEGQVERVQLAGIAAAEIMQLVCETTKAEVIAVAVEAPRGYGGPLLPIVGAVTGSIDLPVEWYAPSSWRKIIRAHDIATFNDPLGDGSFYQTKDGARQAVCRLFGHEFEDSLNGSITDDSWDAAGVALAFRIETEAVNADLKDVIEVQGERLVADIEQFLADQ